MIGIIGAMDEEVSQLVKKMTDVEQVNIAGMNFNKGTLCGKDVVIVRSGIGKVNAAMCAQILCDRYQVSHIINTGVAGSLCADLDIGDFVISTEAVYHDFDCHVLNPLYVTTISRASQSIATPRLYPWRFSQDSSVW